MRLKNILLLAAVAVLVLASGFLYYFKGRNTRNPVNRLADLSFIRNTVQSRYAGKIDWTAAIPKDSLFAEDAVKTHEKSEALITFIDGAFVKIGESSLVIIRRMEGADTSEEMPAFDIVGGSVETFSKNKIQINTPGGSTIVSPEKGKGSIKIEVSKDRESKVSVFEGKSLVTVANKSIEVQKGKQVEFVDKIPEKVVELLQPPEIISPSKGQEFFYTGANLPEISFEVAEEPYGFVLQISKDPDFREVVLKRFSQKNTVMVNTLGSGTYFFNAAFIDEQDNVGVYSPAQKLNIILGRPATKATKTDQKEEAATREEIKSINLSASRVEGKVILQRKGGSEAVTGNLSVRSGDRIEVPAGSYLELSFNKENSVALRSGSSLKVKSILARADSREILADLQSGTIVVNLRKINGKDVLYSFNVKSSVISMTTRRMKSSLSRIAVSAKEDGSLEVMTLEGEPNIQVADVKTSLAANKTIRIKPGTGKPVIETTKVRGIALKEGVKTSVFYNGEPPLVTYLWSGKKDNFNFEISKKPDFKKKEFVEKTDSNHFTDFTMEPGTYYWRYKSGKSASKPQQLSVIKTSSGSYATEKVTVSEYEADRAIVFDHKPPVILLAWDKTKGANAYDVEIFTDPVYRQKIFSKMVPTTNLSFLADFFKEGKYFWRVKRYSPERKLIKMGNMKSFTLKLSNERPPLKIDFPIDNSFSVRDTVLTRGELLRKGSLWINDKSVVKDQSGSFTYTVKLDGKHNQITYKVIDTNGEVSYFIRNVTAK